MLWLFSLLVPFFSAPSAPTLVTLSSGHGGLDSAAWTQELVVAADGTWHAGKRTGRLDHDALLEVKGYLAAIPNAAEPARERCRARAIFHQRLSFGDDVATESVPCGRRWPAVAADLADRLRELTAPSRGPDVVVIRVSESRVWGGAWQPTLTVFADGRWEGAKGQGKLSVKALASLDKAIASTQFALATERETCAAIPTIRTKVVAGSHRLQWSAPCGSEPGQSVRDLLVALEGLTAAK